jgi:hypothetical protein
MTIATNSFTTFSAIGRREDLSDAIYNIAPEETPFMNSVGIVKATNTLHEWQTDTLAAAVSSNQQLEGDDSPSADAVTATVRLGNYTAISRKIPMVTGSQRQSNNAGRGDELSYQEAKMSLELRRDMETAFLANKARNAGAAGTARVAASVLSWIKTNTSKGTGAAADPSAADGTGTRTDGTTRPLTETLVKDVLQLVWTQGGNPDRIMGNAFQRRQIDLFTGGNTRTLDVKDETLHTTFDVYVSSWGRLKIIPNRFMRTTDLLILQNDMWAIAYYRTFKREELAKQGDATKVMLLAEATLESRNEKASGGVFDLDAA